MNEVIISLNHEDVGVKISAAEKLCELFNENYEKDSLSLLTEEKLFGDLVKLANSSNYKATNAAIRSLCCMIKHSRIQKSSIRDILPQILSKSGDSKQTIREASFAFLKESLIVLGLDLLISTVEAHIISTKNWRVKDSFILLILEFMKDAAPISSQSLISLAPILANCLMDANNQCREDTATLVRQMHSNGCENGSDRLIHEELEKLKVPRSRLLQLLPQSSDQVPTYASNSQKSDSAPLNVSNSVISSASGALCRTTSSESNGASSDVSTVSCNNGTDAVELISAWEVNIFCKASSWKEAVKELESIRGAISVVSEDWEQRAQSLRNLRGLVKKFSAYPDQIARELRQFEDSFVTLIKDLRCKLVIETCVTITFISNILKNDFASLAEVILTPLLSIFIVSNKYLCSFASGTIKLIISNTVAPRLIPILCNHLKTNKSKDVRQYVSEFFLTILGLWSVDSIKCYESKLEDSIKCAISDAYGPVRATSRTLFWSYAAVFSSSAKILFSKLEPAKQKLVLKDFSTSHHAGNAELYKLVNSLPSTSTASINRVVNPIPSISELKSRNAPSAVLGNSLVRAASSLQVASSLLRYSNLKGSTSTVTSATIRNIPDEIKTVPLGSGMVSPHISEKKARTPLKKMLSEGALEASESNDSLSQNQVSTRNATNDAGAGDAVERYSKIQRSQSSFNFSYSKTRKVVTPSETEPTNSDSIFSTPRSRFAPKTPTNALKTPNSNSKIPKPNWELDSNTSRLLSGMTASSHRFDAKSIKASARPVTPRPNLHSKHAIDDESGENSILNSSNYTTPLKGNTVIGRAGNTPFFNNRSVLANKSHDQVNSSPFNQENQKIRLNEDRPIETIIEELQECNSYISQSGPDSSGNSLPSLKSQTLNYFRRILQDRKVITVDQVRVLHSCFDDYISIISSDKKLKHLPANFPFFISIVGQFLRYYSDQLISYVRSGYVTLIGALLKFLLIRSCILYSSKCQENGLNEEFQLTVVEMKEMLQFINSYVHPDILFNTVIRHLTECTSSALLEGYSPENYQVWINICLEFIHNLLNVSNQTVFYSPSQIAHVFSLIVSWSQDPKFVSCHQNCEKVLVSLFRMNSDIFNKVSALLSDSNQIYLSKISTKTNLVIANNHNGMEIVGSSCETKQMKNPGNYNDLSHSYDQLVNDFAKLDSKFCSSRADSVEFLGFPAEHQKIVDELTRLSTTDKPEIQLSVIKNFPTYLQQISGEEKLFQHSIRTFLTILEKPQLHDSVAYSVVSLLQEILVQCPDLFKQQIKLCAESILPLTQKSTNPLEMLRKLYDKFMLSLFHQFFPSSITDDACYLVQQSACPLKWICIEFMLRYLSFSWEKISESSSASGSSTTISTESPSESVLKRSFEKIMENVLPTILPVIINESSHYDPTVRRHSVYLLVWLQKHLPESSIDPYLSQVDPDKVMLLKSFMRVK